MASGEVAVIVVSSSAPEGSGSRTGAPEISMTGSPSLSPSTSAVEPGYVTENGSGASAATASRAATRAAQTASRSRRRRPRIRLGWSSDMAANLTHAAQRPAGGPEGLLPRLLHAFG